jgi:hypothetical protein
VSYFVMFRTTEGRLRRFTIGQHGAPWTPDTARAKALAVLSDARVRGADPAAEKRTRREAATVADLCDLYWDDAETGRLGHSVTSCYIHSADAVLLAAADAVAMRAAEMMGEARSADVLQLRAVG